MEELAAFPATEENDPKLLVEALNDTVSLMDRDRRDLFRDNIRTEERAT
jgi:hypothetical protein